MRAIVIHRFGGADLVVEEELPRPEPRPDDLLVAVRAASVNPVDFKIREGALKRLIPYRFPLTLGNDLSGEVVAVGARVDRFKPGDAIFALAEKERIGTFAEYALVRQGAAALKPASLSHEAAASIPLVGLVAWQAMIEVGRLSAGQRMLVHAGSGGVGTFAIQLAKHLGVFVATTASERNRALCERLGADPVIDYKTTRFESVLRDLDLVFDTQGDATLERSFAVVRRGGIVVTIGGKPDAKLAREWGLNPLLGLALRFMMRKVTRLARQSDAHFAYLFVHPSGEQLAQIAELLEQRIILPVLDRTFALAEAKQALAYVESGRAVGKVVLRVS